MNDVNDVYSQVESKLNYANNAFNMELDILIVRKMKIANLRVNIFKMHMFILKIIKLWKIMETIFILLLSFRIRLEILFMPLPCMA